MPLGLPPPFRLLILYKPNGVAIPDLVFMGYGDPGPIPDLVFMGYRNLEPIPDLVFMGYGDPGQSLDQSRTIPDLGFCGVWRSRTDPGPGFYGVWRSRTMASGQLIPLPIPSDPRSILDLVFVGYGDPRPILDLVFRGYGFFRGFSDQFFKEFYDYPGLEGMFRQPQVTNRHDFLRVFRIITPGWRACTSSPR